MFPLQGQNNGVTYSGQSAPTLFEDVKTRSLQSVTVGQSAGKLAIGSRDTFIGYEACRDARNVNDTVAIGYQAAAGATSVQYGVYIGAYAGARTTGGNESVFAGFRSGELNRDGSGLVGIGAWTFRENVAGSYSVATGYRALERCLDGDFNVASGAFACQDLRSASFVTSTGYMAGRAAFKANDCCYFGAFSGFSNKLGIGNAFFGFRSGEAVQGEFNCAIGPFALQNAVNASSNIAIGPYALGNLFTGSASGTVAIGFNAAASNQGTALSVIIGTEAARDAYGSNAIAIGTSAASRASADGLIAIGANAAADAAADFAVVIGTGAGQNLKVGRGNVLVGAGADTFSDQNYFGIAIGPCNTLTSDYGISVGYQIQNIRPNSILIGYDLSSDSYNSVVIGNEIDLSSVVFFRDPLASGFQDTVNTDAINKIGASNILYPTLTPLYASASVNTSNIFNTELNSTSGPITPNTGYDIRSAAGAYAITHGAVFPLESVGSYNTTISTENITSNAVFSTSVSFNSNNSVFALSNYVLEHKSQISVTPDNPLTLNVLGFDCNIIPIPVSIPKRIARSQIPQISANVVSHASALTALQGDPVFQTETWPNAIYLENDGLLPNLLAPGSCQQDYYVVKAPDHGHVIGNKVSSLSNINFWRYPESAYAQSDSIGIYPALRITDAASAQHIISGTREYTINLSYDAQEILVQNKIVLTNEDAVALDIRGIPNLELTEHCIITDFASNLLIRVNGETTYQYGDTLPDFTVESNIEILYNTNEPVPIEPISLTCTIGNVPFTIPVEVKAYSTLSSNVTLDTQGVEVFVARPPQHGRIDPQGAYIQMNPFAINADSADIVIASNALSRDVHLTFPPPPGIFTSNIFAIAPFAGEERFNSSNIELRLTNVTYTQRTVENITSNVTTLFPLDSTSPIIDIVISSNISTTPTYFNITSNMVITSNLNTALLEDPEAQSTIAYRAIYSNLLTEITPLGLVSTNEAPVVTIVDPGVYLGQDVGIASNIDITYDLKVIASNIYAMRSNISVIETERKTFKYYDAIFSEFIYASNSPPSTLGAVEYISANYAVTGITYDTTSNFERKITSNIDIAALKLNRNYYSGQQTYICSEGFVESNIGPVAEISRDAIEDRRAWIRLNSSIFSINDLRVDLSRFTNPSILAPSCNVSLTIGDEVRLPLSDLLPSDLDPGSIQIVDVLHGAIVNADGVVLTQAQTNSAFYQITGKYPNDKIYFFYPNSPSLGIQCLNLLLTRSPTPYNKGQALNKGLSSNYSPIFQFYQSVSGLDDSRIGVVVENGYTTPAEFTMADVLAGQVLLTNKFLTDPDGTIQVAYSLNDLQTDILISSGNLYPLHLYNHASWPDPSHDSNEIRIQALGSNLYNSTVTSGPFWTELEKRSYAGNFPDNLSVIFKPQTSASNGFFWAKNESSNIAHVVSYSNFRNNALHFIPSDEPGLSGLSNFVIDIQFAWEDKLSPGYSMSIKNYISRFLSQSAQVSTVPLSVGLIEDQCTWTKTGSNYTLTRPSDGQTLFSGPWNIQYPFSATDRNSENTVTEVTIDEANRFALSGLTQGLTYYITSPPQHGVLTHPTTPGKPLATFTASDAVYYQHLGGAETDTFSLRFGRNPYDLETAEKVYNVNVRPLPIITRNVIDYAFYSSSNEVFNASRPLSNVFTTSGTGDIVTLASDAIYLEDGDIRFLQADATEYKLLLSPTVADDVNPLRTYPTYEALFVYPVEVALNKFESSNLLISSNHASNIVYPIYPELDGYSNLTESAVTVSFQVQPVQPFSANLELAEVLRTYEFTFVIDGDDETYFNARFTNEGVQIGGCNVQTPPMVFNEWNTITLKTSDVINEGELTLFINNSKVYSALGITINDVRSIRIETDVLSLNNFVGHSNFTTLSDGVLGTFDVTNYATELRYRTFEVTATTSQTSSESSIIHNIILGKDLAIRGIDNICLGNRFTTSGRKSIIIGNDIGRDASLSSSGDINDMYESIIIGNESFKNSVIRDVIAIGRNILNDLVQAPVSKTSQFLSKRPIVVANDVTVNTIDFHINVGNTFLKTDVGGEQIYLGLNGEAIGVGYNENSRLPLGGIYTRHHIATPRIVIECMPNPGLTISAFYEGQIVTCSGVHDMELPLVAPIEPTIYETPPYCFGVVHISDEISNRVYVVTKGLAPLEIPSLDMNVAPGTPIFINNRAVPFTHTDEMGVYIGRVLQPPSMMLPNKVIAYVEMPI